MAIHTAPPWLRPVVTTFRSGLRASRWLALLAVTGCVRVYHPLSGLHDPIVVDPRQPNLSDVAITVRCQSGGYLDPAENSRFCQNVGQLFQNQGARVIVVDSPTEEGELLEGDDVAASRGPRPVSLVADLRSSRPYRRQPTAGNWLFGIATLSIAPVWQEYTFALEITVREAGGGVLLTDSVQGRVVERAGFGAWLVNGIANLARKRENRLTAKQFSRDLSDDLYGQLSQRLFDAKLRSQVIQDSRRTTPGPGLVGGAP